MDCITALPSRNEIRLTSPASLRAVTLYGVVTAMTFSAASGAPTPLYRVY